MNHGSLFSGIGGFDLAAEWIGWENIFQVEIDPYCQKVLEKNFPKVKRYGDIKEFDGTKYRGAIDVLSGGFPCKQTSVNAAVSGNQVGLSGKDSGLWFEMLRVTSEILPRFVVVENVAGVLRWKGIIQEGLESFGYTVSIVERKACYYGLPHSRKRYLFIANRDSQGFSFTRQTESPTTEWIERLTTSGGSWLSTSPGAIGSFNGVSNRVDRVRSIGNAIVPQVAYEIFKAINNYSL